MTSQRERLIALNAAEHLSRAALCRLALNLEQWENLKPSTAEGNIGGAAGGNPIEPRTAALGIPPRQLQKALKILEEAEERAHLEEEKALAYGCTMITLGQAEYPQQLLDHPLPPPVLYCRGEIPQGPAISMVGSRKVNTYGRQTANLFGKQLTRAGLVVVSGFARGVDTLSHEAALSVEGGRTVAVLGCGLDIEYPKGSLYLAQQIAQNGALITEFPFGSPPLSWHFPIRNRVIAALGLATLVVCAAPRSGSLITAHNALELGRDVYAVPGSIFEPAYAGTNALIADGAHLAQRPEDLLEGLCLSAKETLFPSEKQPPIPNTSAENISAKPASPPQPATLPVGPKGFGGKVLAHVPSGSRSTVEQLAERVESPVEQVLGALLELELGGWIQRFPGPEYGR